MAFSKKKPAQELLDQYHEMECVACPLNEVKLRNPKMQPSGSEEPFIYFIGEAPGREEDNDNEFFVGNSGKLLKTVFVKDELRFLVKDKQDSKYIKWNEVNDLANKKGRFNNTIRCRPPNNRDPALIEMECCRPSIVEDIIRTKPKVVVGTGNAPLMWLLGETGVTNYRGRKFPVQLGTHKFWYVPIVHPSYIIRQGVSDRNFSTHPSSDLKVWLSDIGMAWGLTTKDEEPIIETHVDTGISIYDGSNGTSDAQAVVDFFDEIKDWPVVAFDLETNALRPYGEQARILTVAIGTKEKTVAFPLHHISSKWNGGQLLIIEDCFRQFIKGTYNPDQIKVAHNLGFELEWLGNKYGNEYFHNTTWGCTMAQGYILDSRRGGLGLNLLCRQHFGLALKDLSDIDIKNIEASPLSTTLRYNALDTKYTHKLFETQQNLITEQGLEKQYYDQVERVLPLIYAQNTGIPIDINKVAYFEDKLSKDVEIIETQMHDMRVVRQYEQDNDLEYNPRSTKQNQEILRDYLGLTEGFIKGKYTTNAEALGKMNHPLARLLEEHRGLAKILSTYVKGLAPGGKYHWPDDKLHVSYSSTATGTRRLSSSDPNGQNFPARKHREIRSQLVAPSGYVFVAIDYGQIEARIIGMASGDKFLCESIIDGYDIHGDWARKLANLHPPVVGGASFLTDKIALKKFRTAVKNEFVFPLFYGAGRETISLATGIPFYKIDNATYDFWNMFPDVLGWQEDLKKFYEENGYVETLTGFRCRGPLQHNQIINYPIQGTASDIVVDTMVRLSKIANEEGLSSLRPVLNIHDDLTFFIPQTDLDEYLELIIPTMLFPDFDFVNLPLSVEVSVGSNWGNLEELGTYTSDEWTNS